MLGYKGRDATVIFTNEGESARMTDRPVPEEGPSEKTVRNVKASLLQLLAGSDAEVLDALGQVPVTHHTHPAGPELAATVKTTVLQLLTHDDTVRAAIAALVPPRDVQPANGHTLGGSDAEHAAQVVDLIEEKMRQVLRPDAFRRPTYR